MPDPAESSPAAHTPDPHPNGAAARSSTSRWVIYSIVRVVLFVGVFVFLWLLGMDLWLAGIATAIITLCISYIFIPQPKRAPRVEKPDVDAEVEDAFVDEVVVEGAPDAGEYADESTSAAPESPAAQARPEQRPATDADDSASARLPSERDRGGER